MTHTSMPTESASSFAGLPLTRGFVVVVLVAVVVVVVVAEASGGTESIEVSPS